jgi:hypothetical protein
MAAVGLGGFVSPRGWVELANPASTKLSLKLFNINSCTGKISKKSDDDDDSGLKDFSEVGSVSAGSKNHENSGFLHHAMEFLLQGAGEFLDQFTFL